MAEFDLAYALTPRPVDRPGTRCPEYDRYVGLLFSGIDFLEPNERIRVRLVRTIEPEWTDTKWRARFRFRGADSA